MTGKDQSQRHIIHIYLHIIYTYYSNIELYWNGKEYWYVTGGPPLKDTI